MVARTKAVTVILGALLGAAPWAMIPAQPRPAGAPTFDQLLAAQDSRASGPGELDILRAGTRLPDPAVRAFAVRAIGRLERGDLVGELATPLASDAPLVRMAAADAVAQAVSRGEGVALGRGMLLDRLAVERDTLVIGMLAESLGRIPADSAALSHVARSIAARLPVRGAARGLFFLTRQRAARGLVPADVRGALQRVATNASIPADVRETAAAARIAAGGTTPAEQAALRGDGSGGVRALVATAESITDPDPYVRYRAIPLAGCAALATAAADPNQHVALAAVDALARCGDSSAVATLERSPSPRAVVSLASAAPERARARLASIAAAADPFVRVYAVRAANRLRDSVTLRALATDDDANVASEAITALAALTGRADADLYVAALESDAAQLLMAAAGALRDSSSGHQLAPATRDALLAALDRVTALRRETSRDARLALMDALGTAVPARYAADFDAVVAGRAARLTGAPAAPEPLPPVATPTGEELRTLRGATIQMADGGVIELELFPFDAPTNSWRFVRLAREGYFDGLTFHRIAPFFVVQGGSPLANEYVGDGPFTRDEVGLENRRGTVGVSTRGRDTGDGQIFINTVDNARLDHDYTVFARVLSGMDVVDRMEEGARIARVIIHASGR